MEGHVRRGPLPQPEPEQATNLGVHIFLAFNRHTHIDTYRGRDEYSMFSVNLCLYFGEKAGRSERKNTYLLFYVYSKRPV